jgi:hypothetical protein
VRTAFSILAVVLLLANLACAAACAGQAPSHEKAKLPPCHHQQQQQAEPECDHSARNAEFTEVLAVVPALVDCGPAAVVAPALVRSVGPSNSARFAASPPVIPLRI